MTLLGRPQMGSIDFTKIEARLGEHIRQAEKRTITEPGWVYTPALGQHTRWPSERVKVQHYLQQYKVCAVPVILTEGEFDALYLVSTIPSEADTEGQKD